MKVSYQWLKDYIDLDGITPEELAEKMTRGGIEIDAVESRNKGVSGVVVGYVKERNKHPDADKLSVCKVDVGTGEELQIVCGAPNVAAGQRVPVAVVGAKLPGDFKIKRAKLRGVESQGMICSAKELGLNDKLLSKEQQEGILVLPDSVPAGAPIGDVLAIDDAVLELDLTPNRSDCLSMIGAAYEAAALTGREAKLPDASVHHAAERTEQYVSVRVEAPEQCPLYTLRYIKNVRIGPSPQWLQNRLMAAGVRPINNVVDVTNYVMLEYGQPLHAFDADRIPEGRIVVRFAKEGETLVTLDDQERKLEPHMLVIADMNGPIGLAGVMGGASTEVTAATVNIALESAKFDGGTIRKTSRQLGLRSESSLRFEKEVDPSRVIPALDRAAALIAELADGLATDGYIEAASRKFEPAQVAVALEKVNRYLGTDLSSLEVRAILGRLQFPYELRDGDVFVVEVPTRRGDISRDVDLIEEIARLHGYDNIPTTPIFGDVIPGALTKAQAIRRELRKRLSDAGLHEVISYSFTSPERTELFPELAEGTAAIKLSMPMSEERSVLRKTLIGQLIETAAYNRNRKNESLALFEIGSVFHTDEERLTRLPQEKHRFAALLTGSKSEAGWNRKPQPYDFYDAKGVLETIFSVLGVEDAVSYVPAQPRHFHPGRTAAVVLNGVNGPETIGYVGQLHPSLQQDSDLGDTYLAEIALAPLYEVAGAEIAYKALPRYPAIGRDLAVVVGAEVPAASLLDAVKGEAGELLESVRVFDVYTGEKLGAGRKSVALSLVYRHAERTLTDEEVAGLQDKVMQKLEQSFAAELRK